MSEGTLPIGLAAEPKWKRVAFCGFARVGKDEAGKALIAKGYERVCFGDLIKGDLTELIREHLGFSAFTQVDAEKQRIRALLELWGDINYDNIFRRFFSVLPEYAVNTRLVRTREAREWLSRGGVLIWVHRPGVGPCTNWEFAASRELSEVFKEFPDQTFEVFNDSDLSHLSAQIYHIVGINNN